MAEIVTCRIPEDHYPPGTDFSGVVIALIALRQSLDRDIETAFNGVPVVIGIDDNFPKVQARYRDQLRRSKYFNA